MSLSSGTHQLGPDDAALSVRTGRTGAAAKAGHDLVIGVDSWEATLVIGDDAAGTSVELTADPSSLRVIEGSGGMKALDDDDKANIEKTINDEVLEGRGIGFRSSRVQPAADGSRIGVEGELTIGTESGPIAFELAIGDDGALTGSAVVRQTDWGIKPYSTLFGALKVEDEVEVVIEGHL
jgi:polyisoprenoid-binding protein YceI